MVGLVGETVMLTSCAGVMDKVDVPETVPRVAVIVVYPTARLVARPIVPPLLLTVATVPSEEVQRTVVERSWVEPSL